MPGVPRELAEHRIDVNKSSKPIKQRLRRFSPDKKATIKKEITKLMAAGFIREILHLDWLANSVLVQKKNTDEWHMCVDYTYLNKHCPKDPFGLPCIDQIVDSTAGSALLSFLDCYSRYHQIALKEQDIFHHSVRCLLLQDHVVWTQECWRYQRVIQTCPGD